MAQTNLTRALAYLEKLPPAISGSGGHDATLRAACECFRFGLSTAEAWEAMRWYNANRCKPAWTEKSLAHKLADAEKVTAGEFGKRVEGRNFGKRKSRTFQPPRAITQFAPTSTPRPHGITANPPAPALGPTVTDFLADCNLAVTVHDGSRLTLAAKGESLFDKLTARPPSTGSGPADRSQWPDAAHAIAAAAIRERRYGDGWPLATAAEWREWAAEFGELPPIVTAKPPTPGKQGLTSKG